MAGSEKRRFPAPQRLILDSGAVIALSRGNVRARSSSTIDALVVAHAVEARGAQILTGDREDLANLAAPHPEVGIHPL